MVGFFVLFWVDGRLRSTQHWAGRWEEKRAVSLKPRDNVEKNAQGLKEMVRKYVLSVVFRRASHPLAYLKGKGVDLLSQ